MAELQYFQYSTFNSIFGGLHFTRSYQFFIIYIDNIMSHIHNVLKEMTWPTRSVRKPKAGLQNAFLMSSA